MWGQSDWLEANIPFSTTGTFAICITYKVPSTFKCQLCIDLFPALKRDLSLFEVFVGPLLLLIKNYLHEGKGARFLGMQMNIYLIHK